MLINRTPIHGLCPSGLVDLTTRQRPIVTLIADDLTAKEIGDRMGISTKTVEFHLNPTTPGRDRNGGHRAVRDPCGADTAPSAQTSWVYQRSVHWIPWYQQNRDSGGFPSVTFRTDLRLYLDLNLGTSNPTLPNGVDQMLVTTSNAVCTRRLSLLERWLHISEEYVHVMLEAMKSTSEAEREFLRTVVVDTRSEMKTARRRLDRHRALHGC